MQGLYVYDSIVREIIDIVCVGRRFSCCDLRFAQLQNAEEVLTEDHYDFVILPFCRPQFEHLIKYLSSQGTKIYILDNEGGIYESPARYFQKIHLPSARYVTEFWLWGSELSPEFSQVGLSYRVTGRPRFSFIYKHASKFRNLASQHTAVLVNTSFSLCAPKSRDINKEKAIWLKNGEKEDNFDLMYARQNNYREMLLQWLRSQTTPTVVRVHPFEDSSAYLSIADHNEYVSVSEEKLSVADIASAGIVLEKGCTTAVEAMLLNVPVHALDFGDYALSLPVIEAIESYSRDADLPEATACREELFSYIAGAVNFFLDFGDQTFNLPIEKRGPKLRASYAQKMLLRYGFYRYTSVIGYLKFFFRCVTGRPIGVSLVKKRKVCSTNERHLHSLKVAGLIKLDGKEFTLARGVIRCSEDVLIEKILNWSKSS